MITRVNRTTPAFLLAALLFIVCIATAAGSGYYFIAAIPFALLVTWLGWIDLSALYFILIASLPFSFEYNFTSSLGTDIPDEGLMLLVTLLFTGHLINDPSIIDRKGLKHPLLILLLFQFAWVIITVITSTDQWLSFKYLLAKSWYLVTFVLAAILVLRSKKNTRVAAVIFAATLVFIALIALLRHSSTGFSFATINDAVSPFFRNHVNYSSMLVCVIPVLLAFYKYAGKKYRMLLATSIVIVCIALFFSFARGAWLALVAGLISYWLLEKRLLVKAYLVTIVFISAAIFWLKHEDRYLKYAHDFNTTIFHEDFREHIVATYQLKDVSTAERFYRWIAGVRMINDNAITGYGPSSFHNNYKEHAVPAFRTWVSNNPEHSTVHNYFLLLAIEQGLPGLVIFLLLLLLVFRIGQHVYHSTSDIFYKTVTQGVLVMMVMIITVNFLSDLIETDKIGSLFYLCISLIIISDLYSRRDKKLNKS